MMNLSPLLTEKEVLVLVVIRYFTPSLLAPLNMKKVRTRSHNNFIYITRSSKTGLYLGLLFLVLLFQARRHTEWLYLDLLSTTYRQEK